MISSYFCTTERQWVIIKEDIQVWWAERVVLSGHYLSEKKQKKYQIHPVKNAHIFCSPVDITIRGSIPRTGKTKMK